MKSIAKILEQNLFNIKFNRNINDFAIQISFSSNNLLYLDDIINNLKIAIFDKKFQQRLDLNSYFYADSSLLPIPSESTDLIILDHGFEIFNNFNLLVDEIDRILRPNGHVIFFVYNQYSLLRLSNASLKGRYKVNVVKARNEFLLKSYEYINDYKIYYYFDNIFLNIFKILQLVPRSYICIMQKKTPGAILSSSSWKDRFQIIPGGVIQPNYEKNIFKPNNYDKLKKDEV